MPTEDESLEQPGPFGSPDGGKANPSDFIAFPFEADGLATRPDDLRARVLVGRKGTGKTLYLRRLRSFASDQDDLYADHIQKDLPQTEDVIRVSQMYEEPVLTEKWAEIWKRAVLRSLVTHLLFDPTLLKLVPPTTITVLEDFIEPIFGTNRRLMCPLSVYSQLRESIGPSTTRRWLDEYLRLPQWPELEHFLGQALKHCPPVCFYLDAIDDSYAHAPMYWLRCQKGLFYQVMHFLRDTQMGNQLHLVICIRDVVYSSVLRSEHASRYREPDYIRVLNWNNESICHFLRQKIFSLPNKYFPPGTSRKDRSVPAWLGVDQIHNIARGIDEPIDQYLVRHTRLIPRDIVILGNALSQRFTFGPEKRPLPPDEAVIREVVSMCARWFGDEQLQICANQIATDLIPSQADKRRERDLYTADLEYQRGVRERIRRVIRTVGTDHCSCHELEQMELVGREEFTPNISLASVLWQNGLLGYQNRAGSEGATFYRAGEIDPFSFPTGRDVYVFHSALIESVGLRASNSQPVIPW